jgi:hypothetical protein
MWTNGLAGTEESLPDAVTERGAQRPPGDVLERPQPADAGSALIVPASEGGTRVDDATVLALSPVSTSSVRSPASVEDQLRRLEARLLAEAGGDPAVERDVRRHLAESCARFETARVRLFVPILVEREVRRRLRGSPPPP